MKANQHIKFIEGKFCPEEAKELLVNLINNKIQFHTMKNFSSEERFGKPVEGSQKRITELKESREKIILMIRQAVDEKAHLRIESAINIALEK
ncbi:hypothetical protein BH11BAC5_BH11BAC5_17770 [soil metagenome]|jgi:hypothetical protein